MGVTCVHAYIHIIYILYNHADNHILQIKLYTYE